MTGSNPRWPHEWALLAVGLGTTFALFLRGVSPVTLQISALTGIYFIATRPMVRDRWRHVAACIFVMAFYFSIHGIVTALGRIPQDGALRHSDEILFGQMPAIAVQSLASPWLGEVASLGYLSYYVYLIIYLLSAVLGPAERTRRTIGPVAMAFAIGFVGYLLVPAVGPGAAFPELFDSPPLGGRLTEFTCWLVAAGSSVYDAFPSLHVLVTFVMLYHDWRFARWRFWMMVLPATALVFATVYLRFHYAVDLLVGLALVLPVSRLAQSRRGRAPRCEKASESSSTVEDNSDAFSRAARFNAD